jgi:hypothetical protein
MERLELNGPHLRSSGLAEDQFLEGLIIGCHGRSPSGSKRRSLAVNVLHELPIADLR